MTAISYKVALDAILGEEVFEAEIRERGTFDALVAPFQGRLVVHGGGGLGRRVLQTLRANSVEPLAFSDASPGKWGTAIDGIPVLSPEEAASRHGRDAAFIVAIAARGGDFLPIARRFAELSCDKVVPYRSLFWKFPGQCPSQLAYDLPSRILRAKDAIRQVFQTLGDEESRSEFVSQIRWRLWQDYECLNAPCAGEQYFPTDIFNLGSGEVFIDIGAYDGDTLRSFLAQQPRFKKIIAVEPDPFNFEKLLKIVSGLPESDGEIQCRRLCAGSQKQKLRFTSGAGESSQISSEGGIEVDCEPLDEILSGEQPTFIKMDIEGGEPEALLGAKNFLAQGRAIWAVCLYHQAEHLWELPLYMAQSSGNYRFFIRKYVGETWETVCYAVPRERLLKDKDREL